MVATVENPKDFEVSDFGDLVASQAVPAFGCAPPVHVHAQLPVLSANGFRDPSMQQIVACSRPELSGMLRPSL